MSYLFDEKDYKLLNIFFTERCVTEKTKSGYRQCLNKYMEYTKLHLYELLKEADIEEEKGVRWKRSKLKQHLIGFRGQLQEQYKYGTVKAMFSRVKTFYNHFEITMGFIPKMNEKRVRKSEPITYEDIPSKKILQKCVQLSNPIMKAVILFMTSSGCARNEMLSITIPDFIEATREYHNGGTIIEVCLDLIVRDDVIPTFKVHRAKTNKYYHTFCSPEATKAICAYLLGSGRDFTEGKHHDRLFKTNRDKLNYWWSNLNSWTDAGHVNDMRRVRSHMLRKYHASHLYNDGMSIDKIDALQGRSKDGTHNTYFKESPKQLKELYIQHLDAVRL